MALLVFAGDGNALVAAIKQAIDKGEIATWAYDADGDFTHTPDQFREEAWMRPHVPAQGPLTFGIVGKTGVPMTKALYGIYHGRFSEMLLTHFDDTITNVVATAQRKSIDLFK